MWNKKISIFIFSMIIVMMTAGIASADGIAPDRAQQALDLIAVECQNINDYSTMAEYGDTSRYETTKEHVAVTINNMSMLLDGGASDSVQSLWNMYYAFGSDADSARNAATVCSQIRSDIYRIANENYPSTSVNSYDECVSAGYHVEGGTCFIGGTQVFDNRGNLIGYYYSDCYDSTGFHPQSCWDCFYGANNDGCNERP